MNKKYENDEEYFLDSYHDPDSKLWSAYLVFPRPSNLPDDDMELYFRMFDGKWSKQSKDAVIRHSAKGLDLNDNWALVWRGWSCPACGRSKNEIFRLSKRGVLLAKLEGHHDHMADFIFPRTVERFGKDWRANSPPGSGRIFDAIEELAVRFKNCLICSECNAADGKVKIKYQGEIDDRFTFTVSEIARFIKPKAHGDHEIDFEEAFKIWQSARIGFESRLQLIEHLLSEFEQGHLSRDVYGASDARPMWATMGSAELLAQAFREEAKGTERSHLLSNFRNEFLARSTSRDSASLRTPKRPKKSTGPNDGEFATYVDPVSTRLWHEAATSWSCPVCKRAKREILRKSNKGRWTGGLRIHQELIDENDSDTINKRRLLFPDFQNEKWVSGYRNVLICSDCSGIGTEIARHDRSLENPYLSIEDLEDILIGCAAHSRHDLDVELGRMRIMRNASYWSALSAFQEFAGLVSTFRTKLKYWTEDRIPRDDILSDLCDDLRVYNKIADSSDQRELTHWLLTRTETQSGEVFLDE